MFSFLLLYVSFRCEVGTIIIRQGHTPGECYLILLGKFRDSENFKAQALPLKYYLKLKQETS